MTLRRSLIAVPLVLAVCAVAQLGCDSRNVGNIERSAVRACIRSTACGVKSYPRISNCTDDLRTVLNEAMATVLDSIYFCVNHARSCKAVKECYGVIGPCEQSFVASCTDNTAVTCDLIDKLVYRYDCGAAKSTCKVDPKYTFAATCMGTSDTLPELEANCEDRACTFGDACKSDALNQCDGDRLKVCIKGRWVSYDCGALFLSPCKMSKNGWGSCSVRDDG